MEKVRLEIQEHDLIITLDNQETRNALSISTIRQINGEITDLLRKKVPLKAIVYTHNGPVFSSGADLTEFQTIGNDKTAIKRMFEDFNFLLTFNHTSPVPTIAWMKGGAIGGGVGLAMSCQYLALEENSYFKLPELTLGLFPYIISGVLMRRLGLEEFTEMVCFSKTITYEKIVEKKLADFFPLKGTKISEITEKLGVKNNNIAPIPYNKKHFEDVRNKLMKNGVLEEVAGMVLKAMRINSEMILPIANMAASNELSELISFLKKNHREA